MRLKPALQAHTATNPAGKGQKIASNAPSGTFVQRSANWLDAQAFHTHSVYEVKSMIVYHCLLPLRSKPVRLAASLSLASNVSRSTTRSSKVVLD